MGERVIEPAYRGPRAADIRGAGRFLWWLVASQRWRVLRGTALGTAWMVTLTLPPYLLSQAIDQGLGPGKFGALLRWTGALLGLGVLTAVLAIYRHRTMTRVRMDAAFRAVRALVDQATLLGATLNRRVGAGEVATIGIADVLTLSTSLTVAGPGVGALVAYFVVAALLVPISGLLAAIVLLGAPVVAVLVGPLLGRLRAAGAVYRARQGELTTRMVDIVEGLRVLNGIGGKQLYAARYHRESAAVRDEGFRVGAISSWIPALGVGLPLLFLAAVTWVGARLADAHTISVGDLVAVYGYVAVLVVPVAELIESGTMLTQAVVAARRVIAVLRLIPDSAARPVTAQPPEEPAELRDPVSGVWLAVGRFTALASGNPADAVTIVDRLGGFASAEVTWGGIALRDLDRTAVHERILVADNEADLFAGPLRDALAGRFADRSDAAIRRAVRDAAAEDIVDGLAGGLDAELAPRGRTLSGGQRQRLRLARALLADPEILLAVEPTSAVDAHTEAAIAARLRAARAHRTTLVTTTSPLLLAHADLVHHVVDGRVEATGRHADLLATVPGYRALVSRELDEVTR